MTLLCDLVLTDWGNGGCRGFGDLKNLESADKPGSVVDNHLSGDKWNIC